MVIGGMRCCWRCLQRETLLRQLETNMEEIESTVQELDMHEESEEQNYNMYECLTLSTATLLQCDL